MQATIDIEEMLSICLPGGTHCDPQVIADSIRQYAAARQAREWTAEDVSDEQVDSVFRKEWGSDESDRWREAAKGMIAAAANIMSVPQPKPAVAVDVERLAGAIAIAHSRNQSNYGHPKPLQQVAKEVIDEHLRRELPAATVAPESEWPADAPEWADRLVMGGDCEMLFFGASFEGRLWSAWCKPYTGPIPKKFFNADGTWKALRKRVLRRPTPKFRKRLE